MHLNRNLQFYISYDNVSVLYDLETEKQKKNCI